MRLSDEALHLLAAEYVLGTLRGPARRRFESMARADRRVESALRRWEAELTPLAERVPPVEPSSRVWKEIERRIGDRPLVPARGTSGLSPGFWQTFGMLAAGFAGVLAVAFLWLGPQREAEPSFVAVLTASDAVPRMVVAMHGDNELRVRLVKPWSGVEGKSLELWAVPKNGAPRSLGLIENDRDTRIRIASADARVAGANAFAVSLEPRGGSASGQPTGPVLCSGVIAPYQGPRRAA
jgi:anti-sigma-K factor RskA